MALGEMTLSQAAEMLGVHYMSAYRYVRTGRLPARQAGGRWVIEAKDIDDFLRNKSLSADLGANNRSNIQLKDRTSSNASTNLADRLEKGDEGGAWQILEELALATRRPSSDWVLVLAEAMNEIGERWEAGTTSVGDEHRASIVAMRLIGRLGAYGRRRGRHKGTMILAAAPGDRHGLPTAMASEVLRSNGFVVMDLGADVPPDQMWRAAIEADRLLGVGYCATSDLDELSTSALSESVEQVRSRVGCPVVMGGAAITDATHSAKMGATVWTSSVHELVEVAERLHSEGADALTSMTESVS
ncbi:MAG: helix-turn-helix domain-containing protein [Microthrixaceae bacterium]